MNRLSISRCDFCKYRHSCDCDDGSPYPENGCSDFTLDKNTLSNAEQRIFILIDILSGEQDGKY